MPPPAAAKERHNPLRTPSHLSRTLRQGTFLYLVGALLFNIACVYGLLPRSFKRNASCFWAMYYAPSTAGSACFTAAALIEFKHNAHVAWSDPPLHLPCTSG